MVSCVILENAQEPLGMVASHVHAAIQGEIAFAQCLFSLNDHNYNSGLNGECTLRQKRLVTCFWSKAKRSCFICVVVHYFLVNRWLK